MHRAVIRTAVTAALGLVSLVAAHTAVAQSATAQPYPSRPIRLIAPFPAGTSSDLHLRALAGAARKHLGQPIIVENRVGAAGTLGPAQMAQTAKPDGYTISMIPVNIFRLPALQETSWDPATDFTYIIHLTGYVFGTAVRADAPWKTWREFLDYARANPDQVTYATSGHGGTLHVTMEQVAQIEGIRWRPVHFFGNAEQMASVLGGHVTAIASSSGMWPTIEAGKLRLLVVWSGSRSKRFPDVPTLTEGGQRIVSNSPYGIGGPKGMPADVVRTLHDAFRKAIDDPEHMKMLEQLDQEVVYLNSEDYRKFALQQIAEQKALAKSLNLRAQ